MTVLTALTSLPARLLMLPVIAYRRWVSPALPARCRFYPTCSTYAVEALRVHGAVRGAGLVVWRLLRCQPFHPGGYDPVPPARRRRRSGGPPPQTISKPHSQSHSQPGATS